MIADDRRISVSSHGPFYETSRYALFMIDVEASVPSSIDLKLFTGQFVYPSTQIEFSLNGVDWNKFVSDKTSLDYSVPRTISDGLLEQAKFFVRADMSFGMDDLWQKSDSLNLQAAFQDNPNLYAQAQITFTDSKNGYSFELESQNPDASSNSLESSQPQLAAMLTNLEEVPKVYAWNTFQILSDAQLETGGDISLELSDLETGRAISSADALAALKIAVGINPNSNGAAISSYQFIAADINKDGRVTSADALSILKMAVNLADAPQREWRFINENTDLDVNNSGGTIVSRTFIDWATIDGELAGRRSTDNLVAILKGDVNGSWSGAEGSAIFTTLGNNKPRISNPLLDQTVQEDGSLNYTFASDSFTDEDAGTTLTYSATLSDNSALPSWLSFDAATRTFSGTPLNDDVGTLSVKVSATDGISSVSDTFEIVVSNVVELSVSVDNTSLIVAENTIHPDNSPAAGGEFTSVIWSISGADAEFFNIDTSTGDVSFKALPDFEYPEDADGNNVYKYILTVTDQASLSVSQSIDVRVTDVVESATLILSNISDVSINENTNYSGAQPSVSDAIGSVSWSLSGDDASLFTVNASTGVVSMTARNFESPADTGEDNSYNYTLTATDADGNSASQAVTISILDVTETNTLVLSAFNILSVQELDAAIGVTNAADLTSGFEFTFSENIDSLLGTIYLKTSDGVVLESFSSSSTGVSISGSVLTLQPNWSLLPSTEYFFEIGSGAIRAVSGNTNIAIDTTDTEFKSGVETRHSSIAEQFYQVIPGSLGEEQFGDHNTIAVAIDYQDKFEEAHNILTQASDMSSAALYFVDTSYGNMSMNVSLVPDFVMPYSLWAADSGDIGSTGDIRRLTQSSLIEQGILAPDVNLIVYNSHGWLKDGNDAGSSFGGGDWATNAWAGMDVIIHEGGHALGMAHSNIYAPHKDDNISSYGNSWDIQGGGDGFEGQYILPYLRASYDHYKQEGRKGLGWIDENVLLKNPEMGTYRLYAYDDAYFSSDQIHGVVIETTFSDGVIEKENKVDGNQVISTKAVLTFEHRTTHENLDSGILVTRDTYVIGANLDQDGDGRLTQDDNGSAVAPVLVGQTFEYDKDKYVTVLKNGAGYVDLVFAEDTGNNRDPEAKVTISTDQVNSLEYVEFSVEAYDPDGDSFAYFWQFSDGYKSSEASFSRYFDLDRLGTETSVGVTLVVSDMHGGTKKFSDTIYVGTSYTSANSVVLGSLPSSTTSSTPTLKVSSNALSINEEAGSFSITISDINGTSAADTLVIPVTYSFFDVDGNDITEANSARLSALPSFVNISAGSASAQLSLHLVDDSTIQEITLLKVTLGGGLAIKLLLRKIA